MPTGIKLILAESMQTLQYIGFAVILAGDWIFSILRIPTPFFYKEFIEGNKMWCLFILYIGVNFMSANLIQTGGFEITINGNLEYSKIQTG